MSRPRAFHCAASFVIYSELIELVLFGGFTEKLDTVSDTTILRLGKFYINHTKDN